MLNSGVVVNACIKAIVKSILKSIVKCCKGVKGAKQQNAHLHPSQCPEECAACIRKKSEAGPLDCLCYPVETMDKGNHADKCCLKLQSNVECASCCKRKKTSLEKNGVGRFDCSAWFAKAEEFSSAAKAVQSRIIMEASPDEVTCCEHQRKCLQQPQQNESSFCIVATFVF